jgi:Glycoside-hydrolase family GH114
MTHLRYEEPTNQAGRSIGFDFAIAEKCQVYGECDGYLGTYGSHVLEIEYTDNRLDAFTQACRARAEPVSIILRDRDLVPRDN